MTTYVYQRRPAGSPSFEPAGVEEVCQIVGSGLIVKVVRSAPGETVLSLEAHLSKDDGQVASFSCEMRCGDGGCWLLKQSIVIVVILSLLLLSGKGKKHPSEQVSSFRKERWVDPARSAIIR